MDDKRLHSSNAPDDGQRGLLPVADMIILLIVGVLLAGRLYRKPLKRYRCHWKNARQPVIEWCGYRSRRIGFC